MKERDIHPCFSCTLPDCDDTSPKCALRRARSRYDWERRSGQISELTRARYAIAFRELSSIQMHARRSEHRQGARP